MFYDIIMVFMNIRYFPYDVCSVETEAIQTVHITQLFFRISLHLRDKKFGLQRRKVVFLNQYIHFVNRM